MIFEEIPEHKTAGSAINDRLFLQAVQAIMDLNLEMRHQDKDIRQSAVRLTNR